MRSLLLCALALSAATPAFAAPSDTQHDLEAMADRLSDPRTQDAIAGGLGAMLGALLDLRVDGIAKALEPINGGKRIKLKGNTLRDIALSEDPKFEAKAQNGARALTGSMGALAGAMAKLVPQLEAAMSKFDDAAGRLEARDDRTD